MSGQRLTLLVCATDFEARRLRKLLDRRGVAARVLWVVTGTGPLRAGSRLDAALDGTDEVDEVIGFGFAGALSPELVSGSVLIPDSVAYGDRSFFCDEALREGLSALAPGSVNRPLVTRDSIVGEVRGKRDLSASSRAAAVDMESGAWGEVCLRRSIPWAVVRSILDEADETLPPLLSAGVADDGRSSFVGALKACVRHPLGFLSWGKVVLRALRRDSATYAGVLAEWLSRRVKADHSVER